MKKALLNANDYAVYFYDHTGQRARKVVKKGANVEERRYVAGWEVWRKTVSGTLDEERTTLHVMDDQRRIAMVETKTVSDGSAVASPVARVRYQLDNHLGTSILELSDTAGVISYEEYHPYGTCAWWAGDASIDVSRRRYRYTGMERDEETGLQYHSARYYAAWLGRWGSADPIGLGDGVNRLSYSKNNPVVYFDRSGMAGEPPIRQDSAAADFVDSNKPVVGERGIAGNLMTRTELATLARGLRHVTDGQSGLGDAALTNYTGWLGGSMTTEELGTVRVDGQEYPKIGRTTGRSMVLDTSVSRMEPDVQGALMLHEFVHVGQPKAAGTYLPTGEGIAYAFETWALARTPGLSEGGKKRLSQIQSNVVGVKQGWAASSDFQSAYWSTLATLAYLDSQSTGSSFAPPAIDLIGHAGEVSLPAISAESARQGVIDLATGVIPSDPSTARAMAIMRQPHGVPQAGIVGKQYGRSWLYHMESGGK